MAEEVGRLEATFSLDTTPLSAGLKRASSMLQAWAKRWDDEPNAEVGVDISSLQAGLKQASAALERFDGSTATAKLEIDTSQFATQLRNANRQLSSFDGRKAEVAVGADTSDATRSFNSLRRQLSDLSRSGAALRIQANVQQARRDVQEFVSWARQQRVEMTVSAVTTEAQRAAEIAKTYIDNLSANIDIGGNSAAAIAEGRLAAGRINQMNPQFDVGAQTQGAMGDVQGVVRRTNAMRGNFDVGANTQPAESELAGFNQTIRRYSRSWGQQGIRARVQADTKQAQAQLRNLERIVQGTTGTERIRIEAETARAQGQLRGLQRIATGLGMQDPTVSVGVRGVAASTAQMLGLWKLADRLDGYNVRFNASVDQTISKVLPQALGSLEQQVARFRSIATATAAVTVPMLQTAIASLPGVISMAATAAGSLATRLGAGLVGAMGSVGSAAALGGAAIGAYGYAMGRTLNYAFNLSTMLGDQKSKIDDASDAVKVAKAAVASATPGTQQYTNAVRGLAFAEQNLAFETRKMNAMMGFATPATLKLNAAANNLQIEFIKLGSAMTNAQAPMLTRWIQGLTSTMQNSRGAIVGMVTDMNKVVDSFVRTMSKGRELANLKTIFSGIRSAGVPTMQILTSAIRLFVNTFAATVPAGLKVLNVLSRASTAAAKWSGTAAGQSKIRTVWQGLAAAGAQLWRIVRDLGIGLGGVIIALNQTGIGQSMMNGLEGVAGAFRNVMRAGGQGRQAIVEMGHATRPALSAMADLVRYLGVQFGQMAMEVAKSDFVVDTIKAIHVALKGTETSMGIIPMLRHEFEVIGPLLPPLIKQLGLWFSTFAYAQPEMVLFIKTITRVLEAFNSLPQPVQRTMARMLAWGSVIQMLGGTALVGLIAKIVLFRRAMATMRAVQAANGAAMATQAGVFSRMGTAIRGAAAATWTYTRAATVAAARSTAAGVAAAASAIKVRVLSVATRAAAVGMRLMGVAATFMLGPWGLVIAGVIALGAALVIAYRRSETFRNAVNAVGNFIKTTAVAAFRGLVNAARSVWQWFTKLPAPVQMLISPLGALVANFGRIRGAIGGAVGVIGNFARIIGGVLTGNIGSAKAALARLPAPLQGIGRALGMATARVKAFVHQAIFWLRAQGMRFMAWWRQAWPGVSRVLGAALRGAGAVARGAWNVIRTVLVTGVRVLVGIWRAQWRILSTVVRTAFRVVTAVVRAVWPIVRAVVVGGVRALIAVWRVQWRILSTVVRAAFRVVSAVVRAVWPVVRAIVVGGVRALVAIWRTQWRILSTVVRVAFQAVAAVARAVWPVIRAVVVGAVRGIVAGARASWNVLRTVTGAVFRAISAIVRGAVAVWRNVVVPAARFVMTQVRRAWQIIRVVTVQVWQGIQQVLRGAWNVIKGIVTGNGDQVKAGVRGIWNGVRRITLSIWNGIKAFLRGWWDDVKVLVKGGLNAIRQFFFNSRAKIRGVWNGLWNGLKTLARNGLDAIQTFITNTFNSIRQTLFQWRAKVRAIFNGFWNGLKSLWNSSLTAIGDRTESWRDSLRNLMNRIAGWVRDRWDAFWSGLKGLWNRSFTAIGNRTESWRDAFRNLVDRIAKWVRDRWNSFWSGLKGLWDRSWTAIGNRTESWRDAFRNLVDRIAKWVRDRWNSFWSGLRGLWDRSWTAIGNRTESWRDALRNLMDRIAKWVRDRWESFWSGLRSLWDRSLTAVGDRLRSWRDAVRNLFSNIVDAAKTFGSNFAKAIGNGVKSGVNRAIEFFNGLGNAIEKLAGFIKLDISVPNIPKLARGGVTEYARGGVEKGSGQVTNGVTAIAGEAGRESIVPHTRWTPEGQRAYDAVPSIYRDRSHRAGRHDKSAVPPMANKSVSSAPPRGSHSHANDQLPESVLKKKSKGTRGAHVDMSRRHKNVYDYIKKRADDVVSNVGGITWETYHHHITAPGANEHSSVDFWAPGGAGSAIGKSKGDQTARYVANNHAAGNLGTIWHGKVSTGGPFRPFGGAFHPDHVHVGWSTNPDAKIVKGGGVGGFFSGVMDSLGNAYNSVKDFIAKRWNPPAVPNFSAQGKFGEVLGGASRKLLSGAKDWVTKKAEEMLSFGSDSSSGGPGLGFEGKNNRDLGKKMNEAMGWGNQWGALDKLWTKESGWSHTAQNPTSSAYGIPQAMVSAHNMPKGYGPPGGDPKVQIDWGLGYIKGRYGDPNAAWGHSQRVGWYEKGGVVPGFRPMPAVLHGGERVLPRDLNTGFESLSRSIDSWNSRGASAPSVDVASNHRDLAEQNQLLRENNELLRRIYREHPDAIGGRVYEGNKHNHEHDRETRESVSRGAQKKSRENMTGRPIGGR